jgi:hypothetical protein
MDLKAFRGIGVFGTAYREMYKRDSHAEGSVDRALLARMVLLCPETKDFLYNSFTNRVAEYSPGSRPRLEQRLGQILSAASEVRMRDDERRIGEIIAYCAGLAAAAEDKPLLLGGAEEEIIERKSDWCTDVARVACALCQVAGLQARLVVLANVSQAYSGHEIIEVFRDGYWGAADPVYGVVFRFPNGRPASAWDLLADADLVALHPKTPLADARTGDVRAAIVNYPISEAAGYSFQVSEPNDYYRAILTMAGAGWPGGIRWLSRKTWRRSRLQLRRAGRSPHGWCHGSSLDQSVLLPC